MNDCTGVVQSLFDYPISWLFLGKHHNRLAVELWQTPVELIASFGRIDISEMVLKERRFLRRNMRGLALSTAIRSEHLEVVDLICPLRWGLVDFLKSTGVYENLIMGMLHSQMADFSSQLLALLKSCATARYPVDLEEPSPTKPRVEVGSNALQRVNLGTWLLDNGTSAECGNADIGACINPPLRPEHLCWAPLKGAVHGGNVKIVHLPLERGAGVDAPDYDLLRNAVEDNRLDIVRTLVEHGAENKVEGTFTPLPSYSALAPLSQIIKTRDADLSQY
jgi:hypothetical protein